MTNEEIDSWIETDSICFDAAVRGASSMQARLADLMVAFIVVHPEHKAAMIAYAKFVDACSPK